jgi:ADP-ribose pyrophosphatase
MTMPDSERLARIEAYLKLAASRPDLFDSPTGAVRILQDPAQILEVECAVARDLESKGLPAEGARVGVVLRDPWFDVLRDAVEFPDGSRRTHARVINRRGDGAAVLPVLGGKIVLLRHSRYAVGRWLLEIPRGAVEREQSPEEAARTEIEEEIGGRVRRILPLGFVYGLSNLCANGAHLFFAELDTVGEPQLGEGIAAVEEFGVPEFEERMVRGEILDAFTVAAYTHAKLRRLI